MTTHPAPDEREDPRAIPAPPADPWEWLRLFSAGMPMGEN